MWESFEWFFYSRGWAFIPDTPENVAWDFIMGLFGAWLYLMVRGRKGIDIFNLVKNPRK
ncbi:hypothetical protein J4447_02620 [Candidatus Pacearchaeota archaeon]|nr:hypothetical protein [Candidatus Pacearchaeota archaeon]